MSVDEPPAPGGARTSDVRVRLLVAPLVLALVLGVVWLHDHLGHAWPTDLLVGLAGGAAAWELAHLLRSAARPISIAHAVVFSALLAGIGLFVGDDPAARMQLRVEFLLAAVVSLLLLRLLDVRREAIDGMSGGLLPVLYVGLLLSFVREMGDGPDGAKRLALLVLVAKASDVGGWVVGRAIGRHRMVPTVSPGKTWEGTAGGLLASVLVALFLPAVLGLPEATAWSAGERVAYGILLGVASILAGVTQSGWKRRVGAKDSSRLIPHMGGVLDMVDSLLFAAPAAWIWYRYMS